MLLVLAAASLVGCEEANEAPVASFTATPGAGYRALEVAFDATASSDADGEIAGFSWDFGDGGTATGMDASHVYAGPGAYTATLTVTDERGETGTRALTVAVEEPVYPPILTSIEPADGAVVRGAEAWVRWRPSVPARGRVLWRRSGDEAFQSADAGGDDALLARLGLLEIGQIYEYIVEESTEALVLRSGLRTFTVEGGIVFDPPSVEQTVKRDYDQSVALTLRNESDETVVVAARALVQFDDLPADVVGPGSVDEPAELAPGESLALRLAVFAPDATRDSYDIPIEAADAFALVRVRIDRTVFKLSSRVVEEDPRTLAKTIEIRNEGSTLSDLALRITAPSDAEVRLDPDTKHAYLLAGGTLRLVATPVLYLEFEALDAELEATAAAQRARFPLAFRRPPDKRLIGVRSGTSNGSSSSDWYCTNKPNTCSTVSGPKGNGPVTAVSPGGQGSLDERWTPGTPNGGAADSSFAQNLGGEWSVSPYGANFSGSDPRPSIVLTSLDDSGTTLGRRREGTDAVFTLPDDRSTPVPNSIAKRGVSAFHGGNFPTTYANELLQLAQVVGTDSGRGDQVADRKAGDTGCYLADGSGGGAQAAACDAVDPDCEENFERLLSENSALQRAYKELYSGGTPDVFTRSDVIAAYKDLEQRWRGHQAQCPGLPDPSELGPGAEIEVPFTPGDYVEIMRSAEEEGFLVFIRGPSPEEKCVYNREIKRAKRRLGDIKLECVPILGTCSLGGLGAGIVKEMPPLVKILVGVPCAQALSVCYTLETTQRRIVAAWQALSDDPPSFDFDNVETPNVLGVTIRSSATMEERLLRMALESERWKAGYLEAFTKSFERYQGARKAGAKKAMQRQSEAMVNFAAGALQAARRGAETKHQFDRALLQNVAAIESGLAQAGIGWEELLSGYHAPDVENELIKLGLSQSEITRVRERIGSVTSREVADGVVALKRRVRAADLIRSKFTARTSESTWPEPVDVLGLEALHGFARRLSKPRDPDTIPASDLGGSERLLATVPLRPGLLEALQRRASFTRAHRGPFAAPVEGDAGDWAAQAAGWHTGERVVFAWHQQGDKVVFAAFDLQGGVVEPPQVIGTGRWPRLAAAGGRTAVAWESGDGFVARVHDGDAWGEKAVLDGGEAALAFAPDGALHAATTTGLWKLADGRFERLREAAYSQPAIALDGDGQPHVAWRRDGRVMYDDAEVGRGERPTLAFAPDGAAHLAYLSDGALVVRARRDGDWAPPQTIPARNPSWPALALGGDGVRLTYLGAAEHGPDALWLVRLPDPEPLLMPSLAGNVTDAWFTIKFGLKKPRSKYRPHDVLVTVNDVWIKLFSNTVPDGRHLFRLNPYHVFTSTGRPVPNRVAIRSWHMNGGSYSSNSEYQLVVRTAWSEHFALASSDRGALDAIGDPRANHGTPDLVLLANAIELPVERPEPGTIELPVTVANLGEARSRPTRLLMHANGQSLGAADVVALEPGALKTIPMTLHYDGRLENIAFRLDQDEPDFDPANDSLTLTLWGAELRPRDVAFAGGDEVGDSVAGDPGAGIRLEIAGAADALYRWEVVETRAPDKVVAQNPGSERSIRVPPGEYQVAITPTEYNSGRLVWPEPVRVEEGEVATVAPDSGIRLELRADQGTIYQWQVVEAENPDRVVQQYWGGVAATRTMLVPPGDYRVAITPTEYSSGRLVWPEPVRVEEGEVATLAPDSGIRLELPADQGTIYQWQVVEAENPDRVVQQYWGGVAATRTMLVPPGEYQVAITPTEYNSGRLVWPEPVRVEEGGLTTASLDSGVRIVGSDGAGSELDVRLLDAETRETVHWTRGSVPFLLLVPAGTYIVEARAAGQGEWRVLADALRVEPHRVSTVE